MARTVHEGNTKYNIKRGVTLTEDQWERLVRQVDDDIAEKVIGITHQKASADIYYMCDICNSTINTSNEDAVVDAVEPGIEGKDLCENCYREYLRDTYGE